LTIHHLTHSFIRLFIPLSFVLRIFSKACHAMTLDQVQVQGRLAGFDAYHKRSKVCYDDGQEEWISLAKERFRSVAV